MIIKPEWLTNNFENEMQFQAALVIVLSREFPQLRYKIWHTKNETFTPKKEGESEKEYKTRQLIEGNRNKAQGMLAGIPDLLIRYKGITYGMELKQPKGDLNHAQMLIHDKWKEDCQENPNVVVYTIKQAIDYCLWILSNGYLLLTPKQTVELLRNIGEDVNFYSDEELKLKIKLWKSKN